jgi:predicted transcriptional regulator
MADTELLPDRQVEVLHIVRAARGPISTRLVALRTRLEVPVASRVLNRLADFGIIAYDTDAQGWVHCG